MKWQGATFAVLMALPVLPATAATTPPQAAANAPSVAQGAIEKLEQRWTADIARGDRDDLAAMLADDYRDIDWKGVIRDKSTLLAGLHASADATQHITQLQVRVWGDTAVATGINEVRSRSKGWTVEVPFTDVFARIDGHWLAVSSQETLRKPSKS
ncbi:MAG TPA: nuclear transport factor 2 family protein [Rhodanobacteraceae bacterium]|nr:nuclear transport factor 2 family protein [Rhodanobacteraceae bacterium]